MQIIFLASKISVNLFAVSGTYWYPILFPKLKIIYSIKLTYILSKSIELEKMWWFFLKLFYTIFKTFLK